MKIPGGRKGGKSHGYYLGNPILTDRFTAYIIPAYRYWQTIVDEVKEYYVDSIKKYAHSQRIFYFKEGGKLQAFHANIPEELSSRIIDDYRIWPTIYDQKEELVMLLESRKQRSLFKDG